MSGGDELFAQQLIDLFADELVRAADEITAGREQDDLQAIWSAAHRIRPSICELGIQDMGMEILRIERLASNGERGERLNSSIASFCKAATLLVWRLRMGY